MNKALLLMVALLCCAGVALAQPPAFQLKTFHFIHVTDGTGATAVEFQCDMSQIPIIQDFGDISPFPLKIGTFRNGVSLSYGGCLQETPPGYVYLGSTTIKKASNIKLLCKYVYVKNHPTPGIAGVTYPLGVGCPTGWIHLRGSYAIVSWDHTSCPCPGTIPTEESSWGQIKAQYE
ncbi:MAG: hypothetical protein HY770_02615 [Chitinivibrionia bacterium]|nr:hypothetical protein [Chitinivibrionia bacterium]